ncbi:MAG: hypothetical protein WB791_10055 [Waddliaceae bacterium]
MPNIPSPSSQLLGDYEIDCEKFPGLDKIFSRFREPDFQKLPFGKKLMRVSEVLCQQIANAPHESFLLAAVIEYIARVNDEQVLEEPYHFTHFEFWLNHFSGFSKNDNDLIRAKIVGKFLPRDEYQAFFPIGMDNVFFGTHFVSAHQAPDTDTTIASFWGWVDAYAARVGDQQHIWSLPGGPPDSPVTQLFRKLFGKTVFENLSRAASMMTLSAMDMVTEKHLVKAEQERSIDTIEHGFEEKALILVDEEGSYCGDWRSTDRELVQQVLFLYQSCLEWLENYLHHKLISLFAQKILRAQELPRIVSSIFDIAIKECEPIHNLTEKQTAVLDTFLKAIINMPKGLEDTFSTMIRALKEEHSTGELAEVKQEIISLQESDLFDSSGIIKEDRTMILTLLESIIHHLDLAVGHAHQFAKRLGIMMRIKNDVIGAADTPIPWTSEIEDIRVKIKNFTHLTVVIPQKDGRFFPVGVIWANDLRRAVLGTASFRDFSTEDEVHMASYLSVISVIDHHKSSLTTTSIPSALIGDAQSCNVLIAEQLFQINERYSLGGIASDHIEEQIRKLKQEPVSTVNARLLGQLLSRQIAIHKRGEHYIHPKREFVEYLTILHAILDDTDLLTKVSFRDVVIVASLLNKMKSLSVKQEVEIIHLDHLPRDKEFAKAAAKRILKNPEMYSLYRKIYASKEREIEENLKTCEDGDFAVLFNDTKEQNGCCRIGQIKLFSCNIPSFLQQATPMRKYWVEVAQNIHRNRQHMDLHMLMISTIPSADEVYEDKIGDYLHQDELWLWIPEEERAKDHLTNFLNAFQASQEVLNNRMDLEVLGPHSDFLTDIFQRNFPAISTINTSQTASKHTMAILRFNAGSINSRKSMISPYLPRLIP